MRFVTVKAWASAFLASVMVLGAQLGAAWAQQPWLEKLNASDQQKFTRLAQAHEMAGDRNVADRIYLRELEADATSGAMNATYARLRLFYFRDIDGAIKYGEKAYSLLPSAWNRSLVTIAWLVRSSDYLKANKSKEAKKAFARAREIGIDRASLQTLCSNLCNDINLPLVEFR